MNEWQFPWIYIVSSVEDEYTRSRLCGAFEPWNKGMEEYSPTFACRALLGVVVPLGS